MKLLIYNYHLSWNSAHFLCLNFIAFANSHPRLLDYQLAEHLSCRVICQVSSTLWRHKAPGIAATAEQEMVGKGPSILWKKGGDDGEPVDVTTFFCWWGKFIAITNPN